ncbi:lipoate--protein ligase family protein [Arcobacter vandammei]|uniref:lipoate--protein ligase family protein n=1 Tax=Arcobacter vandammei TaxID=2782243 RepID=UPI0018E05FC4|nr:lipoate--protein ligase family protein [Arcobacter vandammei]
MNFNNKFRLIISQNLSSKVNSNIDKALFKNFVNSQNPILRIYSWEDSLTFGAGQNIEDFSELKNRYQNNVSKRLTGGGVLFHGHDISYTILLSPNQIENKDVKETYFLICQFLIKFYENLGLKAHFAKDDENIILSKSPFCQIGFEAYDIIIDGKKIGGNAQKRAKFCILQHGSIPLFSKSSNDFLGSSLQDFGINIGFIEAKDSLIKAFKETFEVEFINDDLDENEKNILKNLEEEN